MLEFDPFCSCTYIYFHFIPSTVLLPFVAHMI
jgi:hypothetical protein